MFNSEINLDNMASKVQEDGCNTFTNDQMMDKEYVNYLRSLRSYTKYDFYNKVKFI